MKERPIIFSSEMVRAILEGRKTQTRRVIKPQPKIDISMCDPYLPALIDGKYVGCPYGQPGDRLWVRENFMIQLPQSQEYPHGEVEYAADYPIPIDGGPIFQFEGGGSAMTPSIYMPRWASRIMLEITGVRVERVQDITHQDAVAEGIQECPGYTDDGCDCVYAAYAKLWDSINLKRGFGWNTNPWVWVVELRVLQSQEGE